MKCQKCNNTKIFELEEKNWVTYKYKNKIQLKEHKITGSCEENDMSHVYCSQCGIELDLNEFREFMGWN